MSDAERMMLHAISHIGMARSLKRDSKVKAIIELNKSAVLMNKSITLEPQNIENRKSRLRHLLGVTMKSPRSFHKEIKDDLVFFEESFNSLNNDNRGFYLSALGEYEVFCGNKEKGSQILKKCIEEYPEASMYEYTKITLESLK